MNEYFEQNKRSLILLATMLFILALVLYFMLVRPLITDYKRELQQIDNLSEEIALLETQIESLQETSDDFDIDQLILENKIPNERELDEYILAIQQLELYTESKIDSIQFTYDSSIETEDLVEEEEASSETEENDGVEELATEEEISDETEEAADDGETNEEEADEEDAEETDETDEESPAPTIDPAMLSEKPENLHVMTVRLSVVSPDFDEFIELLKLIENNERISIVTNLNFTKPTEQDIFFEDNPLEEIPFDAEITTFYYKE